MLTNISARIQSKNIESIICHFPPQLLFFFEINTQESTNKRAKIFFRASTPGKKTSIAANNKNLTSTSAILFNLLLLKIKEMNYKQNNLGYSIIKRDSVLITILGSVEINMAFRSFFNANAMCKGPESEQTTSELSLISLRNCLEE